MFEKLEVNGEEIPHGTAVYFGRSGTWWDQPASREAYLIVAILIALAVALALVIA
jgi:hypothetical protein